MKKNCKQCDIEYNAPSYRYKYCSKVCQSLSQSQWVRDNQKGSNNPFYGKKHSDNTKIKQSKSKKDLVQSGWKPASYIDGRSKIVGKDHLSRDTEWRKIRKLALDRDNYTCQLCKGAKATQVHHIVPRKLVKVHNLHNLISLCKLCHELTYQKELEFVHIFLGILRDANGENLVVDNPVTSIQENVLETDKSNEKR